MKCREVGKGNVADFVLGMTIAELIMHRTALLAQGEGLIGQAALVSSILTRTQPPLGN